MVRPRAYHKSEDGVKISLADYLNYKYPFAPFRMEWDHLKLPSKVDKDGNRYSLVGKKLKRMRWAEQGFVWPDCIVTYPTKRHHGLFLEIKKDRAEIYRKDGTLREDQQTYREFLSLERLKLLGHQALFTWSIDHGMNVIDEYFEGVVQHV